MSNLLLLSVQAESEESFEATLKAMRRGRLPRKCAEVMAAMRCAIVIGRDDMYKKLLDYYNSAELWLTTEESITRRMTETMDFVRSCKATREILMDEDDACEWIESEPEDEENEDSDIDDEEAEVLEKLMNK